MPDGVFFITPKSKEGFYSKVPEWRDKYPETSDYYPEDDEAFLDLLLARGEIAPSLHKILLGRLEMPPVPEVTPAAVLEEYRKEIGDALFDKISEWFRIAYHEVLVSLWKWLIDKLKDLIKLVVDFLTPLLKTAWEGAKEVLTESALMIYEKGEAFFEGHSPVTPEDAPAIAYKLYAMAWGAGMLAHGISTITELAHPLKRMGLHHTAAMIGDYAQFGRIAGATIGPLITRVLGQAMTYNVQDKYRPRIPDERMLQIMAVKPDITPEQFRSGMGYAGYSDEWIDAVERTMYHEPRYFELKMMSEDEAASEDWLFTKSRRAGFTETDSKIMVSSYLKTATRTQRLDYYRQGFYLYKEGFIDKEGFESMLDELELRPEAKLFCTKAAELAYLNDYIRDMVGYYVDSYIKDLISEDELLVSLVSLGITSERAWLIAAKAKVRKTPKPARPTTKAAEKAVADIQKKYITLYVTQYRKGLITDSRLRESLLSIGLTPDLAEVTVSLEAAKKGLLLPA